MCCVYYIMKVKFAQYAKIIDEQNTKNDLLFEGMLRYNEKGVIGYSVLCDKQGSVGFRIIAPEGM